MRKKTAPPKTKPTPFDNFAEAAKKIFTLPKKDVEKVKVKTPPPQRKA